MHWMGYQNQKMSIDLHVHTQERSLCARSPEEAQIQAAISCGLDAVAITDHDRLVPEERLAYLNAKYAPFCIFGGIEVSLHTEHVLVLGIHDATLERRGWTYCDLHRFVEEENGFLALAHPFRFNADLGIDIEQCTPHAMEVRSCNTPRRAEDRIRQAAARLGIPLLANSDAHHVDKIGPYYNVLNRIPADEEDLVRLLKEGAFKPQALR